MKDKDVLRHRGTDLSRRHRSRVLRLCASADVRMWTVLSVLLQKGSVHLEAATCPRWEHLHLKSNHAMWALIREPGERSPSLCSAHCSLKQKLLQSLQCLKLSLKFFMKSKSYSPSVSPSFFLSSSLPLPSLPLLPCQPPSTKVKSLSPI